MSIEQENTDRGMRAWLVGGALLLVLLLFFVAMLGTMVARGDWIPLILVGVGAVGLLLYRLYVVRRVPRLWRSATPEPLCTRIDLYYGRLHTMPLNERAMLQAASRAQVRAWYGRFDEVEDELAQVDWAGDVAPMYKAPRYFALGISDLLRGEVRTALQHARSAKRLASISKTIPGARASEDAHEVLLAVTEGLADGRPDAIEVLERSLAERKRHHGLRMLARWGLARLHHVRGDDQAAHAHAEAFRLLAPHCVPPLDKPESYRGDPPS